MAFRLKYNSSDFPFKPSPNKLFGGGKPSSGYGSRPGEMAAGSKGIKAQQRLRNVRERRDAQGGPKIKSVPILGSTSGKAVGGEYQMGMADLRIFGGVGKKALRDSGRSLMLSTILPAVLASVPSIFCKDVLDFSKDSSFFLNCVRTCATFFAWFLTVRLAVSFAFVSEW